MEFEGSFGLLVQVALAAGTLLGLPWLIKRKIGEIIHEELRGSDTIKEIVAERTEGLVTELQLIKGYVSKEDFERHSTKVEKELRWQRRMMLAMASALKIPVPHDPDDD